MNQTQKVPTPTLERLATYFRYLCDLETSKVETISSSDVELQTGVNAAQFRKDLSYFGEFGKPGVGYNVVDLQTRIAQILKIDQDQQVVVLGAGNLGTALLGSNPAKIGIEISGLTIQHIDHLIEQNHHLRARIAIVAVPSDAAQTVAHLAIKSGIRALLNFAPIILQVPEHVSVRNVSFMQELAVLSHHLSVDNVK